MKTRDGFVSNSSSSSFIVIEKGAHTELVGAFAKELLKLGHAGETEFGWGPDDVYGAFSKINFAFLQSEANPEWRAMLERVVLAQTGASSLEWALTSEFVAKAEKEGSGLTWGYVDHQSAACEGQNIELFDSEEVLKDFLFNPASYIHLDNDNY